MAENKCDELFGKNGELVEFRKKQVLEGAFGIIRRYYKDKPNKIEMIAKLFGKEIGEEFKAKVNCTTKKVLLCRFSKKGLCYQEGEKWNYEWFVTDLVMAQLICGEAVILD